MKHLKDFGFGKVGLQGVIQDEVEDLVKHLSKLENQDFRYEDELSYYYSSKLGIFQNGNNFWSACH